MTSDRHLKRNLFGYLLDTPSHSKWRKIGAKRRSGVLVPLFSVHSKNSVGIGDFSDLTLLCEWAEATGNSIIQLLPMNEVGSVFCPYDSISSFALEPMYISLSQLSVSTATEEKIESLKKKFPTGAKLVDYKIKKEKLRILREVFLKTQPVDSKEFEAFKRDQEYWLLDFALFKILKNKFDEKPWFEWEEQYKNRASGALDKLKEQHQNEIIFQMWVQWQLFVQLKKAKAYAQMKKIILKGDLPILVSRDSADVWAHPGFFKLDYAAGAPPDMYCAKGQRWGMPTYNWEAIISDSWKYLKEKLKFAQNFYDILRIDHVVGLFRIWSTPYSDPLENQGLNGFFDPRDEKMWGQHGRNILTFILNNTAMLLCAEDLGVIPRTCTEVLRELGIPGNDVARWVKDWAVRHDFLPPEEFRPVSVAMLSTHDTTNFCAWWENEAGTVDEALFIRKCNDRGIDFKKAKEALFDPGHSGHGRLRWRNQISSVAMLVSTLGKRKEEVADFIDIYENTYLEKEKLWKLFALKGAMREKSDKEIMRKAFELTLQSSAIFCVNTIVDWLYLADAFEGDPYQYRINTPGTTVSRNWSLLLPLSLEQMLKNKANAGVRAMVSDSGRV